jgi:uncharacterized protein YndB with AHSA1/START domain
MTDIATDYATVLSPDTVRIERNLPGPIDKVWAYLTDSEKRATWLARGQIELREGGLFEFTWFNSKLSPNEKPPERHKDSGGHSMKGRVLACDAPRRLVITWSHEDHNSEVAFDLTPEGDRTRLVLTHSLLATRKAKVSVAGGWHIHLLILEDRLNGVKPRPFWSNHERLEAEYEKRL